MRKLALLILSVTACAPFSNSTRVKRTFVGEREIASKPLPGPPVYELRTVISKATLRVSVIENSPCEQLLQASTKVTTTRTESMSAGWIAGNLLLAAGGALLYAKIPDCKERSTGCEGPPFHLLVGPLLIANGIITLPLAFYFHNTTTKEHTEESDRKIKTTCAQPAGAGIEITLRTDQDKTISASTDTRGQVSFELESHPGFRTFQIQIANQPAQQLRIPPIPAGARLAPAPPWP